MPSKVKKKWPGRVYTGKVDGKPQYTWLGRFTTKTERDDAVAEAKLKLRSGRRREKWTCSDWAERYLTRYAAEHKASSAGTARAALRRFVNDFGTRRLDSITRTEAQDWSAKVPVGSVVVVISMLNDAVDSDVLDKNPFRSLAKRGKGRSDTDPPTAEQFDQLLHACDVHGFYAPHMRSLLTFAAYTGLRPGELYPLEWSDIDLDAMRVHVERRLYNGKLDTPKSGKARTISLPPPARDALLRIDAVRTGLVFRSKQGHRLSQSTLQAYWKRVTDTAGLDFDFYLATKHRCVHHFFVELGLPAHVVASQMGWSLKSAIAMLETYSHHEVGALEEIDAAFSREVVPLRAVESP